MRRVVSMIAGAATALTIIAIAAPVAGALTGVQYASNHGVAPGIANLVSTSGHEHRTYNQGLNALGNPPSNGVNLPIKIRILLQAGGETSHVGGVNAVFEPYAGAGPKGKAQCWVPTHAGGYGGILNCHTTRP